MGTKTVFRAEVLLDGFTSELEEASKIDTIVYRRVQARLRERYCEATYQAFMRTCLDSAELAAGIRMRQPEEGETWCDCEPELQPTPISLPDETISARQYAAEWLLLWGEALAWASMQVFPDRDAVIDEDDHRFVRELTGNFPSQIVARWCNVIVGGAGKRRDRERPKRECWNGSTDNIVRAMES